MGNEMIEAPWDEYIAIAKQQIEQNRHCIKLWETLNAQQKGQMQTGLRIQELKEMDYKDYLQTPEWNATRKKMFRRADYQCQLCNANKTTLNVHHKTYDRLGAENYDDLIVLCENCHAKFHDKV